MILVGEMRDLPTISFAVTAAETGHLVFGTCTPCPPTPPSTASSTRSPPARATRCARCWRRACAPCSASTSSAARRTGRVLAAEVLLNNDAVSNLIRKGKAYQIPSVVATSREQGMQAMDAELRRLVREGVITAEEAYMRAASKKDFEKAAGAPARRARGRRPGRARG